MKKLNLVIITIVIIAMILSGCQAGKVVQPIRSEEVVSITSSATATPSSSDRPIPTESSVSPAETTAPIWPEGTVLTITSKDDIKNALLRSIKGNSQLPVLDISKCDLGSRPDLALINIYFDVISEQPELKYAYKMMPDYQATENLIASEINYMPFKSGNFPEDFAGSDVHNYDELIRAAETGLGQDSMSIRITNPKLDVDTMNRSLQQVGGAYVVCGLNNDATKIVFQPSEQRTMAECLDYLAKVDKMADAVIAELITPDMSDEDKVLAIYSYLTSHVKYDQRFYSDPASMPYESRTAYGAFKDGLAICGGYAHALKLLLNKAGIECYFVSGVSHGEDHAWNVAFVSGQWIYYDATFDRNSGGDPRNFRYFGVGRDVMETDHAWDWCQADTSEKVA